MSTYPTCVAGNHRRRPIVARSGCSIALVASCRRIGASSRTKPCATSPDVATVGDIGSGGSSGHPPRRRPRAGRAPRRCVKTGVPADEAVRVQAVALRRADLAQLVAGFALTRSAAWLLRRPSFTTVVAVSPQAWRRWQRSLLVPAVIGPAGAALVAFGVIAGAAPAAVFGALLVVGAALLRWRATRRWWIGVRFRPDRDEIVVTRVSVGFDEDARRLFVRSVTPPLPRSSGRGSPWGRAGSSCPADPAGVSRQVPSSSLGHRSGAIRSRSSLAVPVPRQLRSSSARSFKLTARS